MKPVFKEMAKKTILDSLPELFWKHPRKILFVCCDDYGLISFLLFRLMEGLVKIRPRINGRYRFIIKECLFFANSNHLLNNHIREFLDPLGNLKPNIYPNDIFEMEDSLIKEFDLIVMSPSYEFGSEKVYKRVIQHYWFKTRFHLVVIPSEWFSVAEEMCPFAKVMFARVDAKVFKHHDDSNELLYNEFQIEGGLCWILFDSTHRGETIMTHIENHLLNQ
jgi:hypothetical protein